MKRVLFILAAIMIVTVVGCKKDDPVSTDARLLVKIKFDSTLSRLDNFGNPATIPANNSAQSPVAHLFSAHYIELAPTQYTQLGDGAIIYKGAETSVGGDKAVDFSQAKLVGNDELFATIPISSITPGTYEWIRVSLTYQNGDIKYLSNGYHLSGRLSSFVGYNTYITSHTVDQQSVTVNGNRQQGYWAFETVGLMFEGQAEGTTVPNPIAATSPVPPGSCVVTGSFPSPLTITGEEEQDVTVYLKFSTNKSFEWYDVNQDGYYEPAAGDSVVDMGLRGLFPTVE